MSVLRSLLASPGRRVVLLTSAVAAAAASVHLLVVPTVPAVPGALSLPWWLLAGAFALAEINTVYVHFGRQTHSWAVTEVPLTIGLAFASPDELVIGSLVGYAVALIGHHRQRVVKWSFNLALAWLETVAAVVLYRSLLAGAAPHGGRGWLATFAAVGLVTWGISGLGVPLAMSVHEGRLQRDAFRWVGKATAVSTVVNTSVGLLAVSLLVLQPTAIWLLGIVLVMTLGAYRAYGTWRLRQEALARLQQLDQLDPERDANAVAAQLLEHARGLLRAEVAELLLLKPDGRPHRHVVSAPPEWTPVFADPLPELASLPDLIVSDRRLLPQPRPALLARDDLRDGLLVVLGRGRADTGVLLIANRLDDVTTFRREDLRVLQAFAQHVRVTVEVSRLLDRLREEAEDRRRDALHDALTGLPNRAAFNERLQGAIDAAGADGHFAVLLLDLDHFKEVNDTLGHQIGDVLLRKVADRLLHALPAGCSAARLGGDEFVVLAPLEADLGGVLALADACRAALTATFAVGELQLGVEASIGVALYPEHGRDASRLLQSADVAMYSAKRSGSQIEVYDAAVDAHTPRRLTLLGGLRAAIDRAQLEVHYQPKVSTVDGQVIGVEALVRWRHPQYGFIAPAEFLPLAEHSGLIHLLGQFVLRSAVRQAVAWRTDGLELEVAVNLSARNLLDRRLPGYIGTLLEEHDLPPAGLRLEITETSMMSDPHRTIPMLELLNHMGLGLSMDDFGTGHSSLSYLKGLPVDELKVDRSFVRDMATDAEDALIVRSTIDLARNLGLRVIAEGVEDHATWRLLAELGCDAGQGYVLMRPASAGELERWLAAHEPSRWAGSAPRANVLVPPPRSARDQGEHPRGAARTADDGQWRGQQHAAGGR